MLTMQIDWGSATHTGRVRENNEDSLLVRAELGLAVLCDGMGGHRAGEVASRLAVLAFAAGFEEAVMRSGAAAGGPAPSSDAAEDSAATLAREVMLAAARKANEAVFAESMSTLEHRGMGCTLVALCLRDGGVSFASVGDSRLYLLRGGTLFQVSEDHTRLRMLERMGVHLDSIESKRIRGVLTRAVGTLPDLEVDCGGGAAAAGDGWLLCSDGLTDELENEEIGSILSTSKDSLSAARNCVQRAVMAGGRDNVSVIVARIIDGPGGNDRAKLPKIETIGTRPASPAP
jgi:PPM family protein phosphatase